MPAEDVFKFFDKHLHGNYYKKNILLLAIFKNSLMPSVNETTFNNWSAGEITFLKVVHQKMVLIKVIFMEKTKLRTSLTYGF
jgi:hypothetical protein